MSSMAPLIGAQRENWHPQLCHRAQLTILFSRQGCGAVIGEAGTQAARPLKDALVLLDIGLGNASGFAAFRRKNQSKIFAFSAGNQYFRKELPTWSAAQLGSLGPNADARQ